MFEDVFNNIRPFTVLNFIPVTSLIFSIKPARLPLTEETSIFPSRLITFKSPFTVFALIIPFIFLITNSPFVALIFKLNFFGRSIS